MQNGKSGNWISQSAFDKNESTNSDDLPILHSNEKDSFIKMQLARWFRNHPDDCG